MEQSLAHLLIETNKKFGNNIGFSEKVNGQYMSLTFNEFYNLSKQLARSIISFGLKEKEIVAILSHNCINWAKTDYATLLAGLTNVPIYPSLLSAQIEFILKDSDSKLVFVQNKEMLEKVLAINFANTKVEKVIVLNNYKVEHEKVLTLDEFLKYDNINLEEELNKRTNALEPMRLATIIYTSGTTGNPKGVMLSHDNILHNVENALKCYPITHEDSFLSFLPLCHIFERMAGHYVSMSLSVKTTYAESIDTVAANMLEVKPTVMLAVPRLYEKIYAKILDAVEKGSPLKRLIFNWAVGVGKIVANNYTCIGKKPSGFLAVKYSIASALVFNKLKAKVGGNLKLFVSGGGALNASIAEFFASAGLIVLEGYGLTETSPVITVNRMNHFKFGFVGPVIPDVQLKIAEDGEILTKSRSVMKGYYKNDEATKEAFTDDGWFKTGDIGEIDTDGFLKITDRKKNLIVTSGGKKVAPQPIEGELLKSKYIDQVIVMGDKRKYCSAIIVATGSIADYAKTNNISGTMEELVKNEKIKELINLEISLVNKALASFEQIKKFVLLAKPFTIESGELTPKLSIKKKEVIANNLDAIEELYKE
jgi:long-chain acyl-CoA synthetase